jgi:undecaprenyl-diphosphatase
MTKEGRSRVGEIIRTAGLPWLGWLLVMITVMSAVGLLLTHVLDDTALVHFDVRTAQHLADSRTPRFDTLTGAGTFIADPISVATLWLIAVVAAAWITRSWVAPAFILGAIGGEKLSYLVTTLIVERPRPEVPTIGKVHFTSSYPSGHVGSAITLYGSIAILLLCLYLRDSRRWRVVLGLVVATLATIVALSRLYRGHHFVTDVVCGALVGIAWLAIAHHLTLARHPVRRARQHRRRSSDDRPASEHRDVDVLTGEDRARGGHRVRPHEEMLRDRVDVS